MMSHFHSKQFGSPHRLSFTFSHLCKLILSSIVGLLTLGIWAWEFSGKPISISAVLAELVLSVSWLTSTVLLRSEFVKTGGNSKYLVWWWLFSCVCEVSMIPVRLITSSFFAEMAAGEVMLLILLSSEILLTVGGFISLQDVNSSHYFEFNLEQYNSEGEQPKPLEDVWRQFETARITDMEEAKKQELQMEKEMSQVKEARATGFDISEVKGKIRVVRCSQYYTVITKRGKHGIAGEVKRKYKECLALRNYLQSTFPCFKVPDLLPRLAKGKKLKEKDIDARRLKLDKLVHWIVELQIDDARVRSFLFDAVIDDNASDSSETMDFAMSFIEPTPPAPAPVNVPAPIQALVPVQDPATVHSLAPVQVPAPVKDKVPKVVKARLSVQAPAPIQLSEPSNGFQTDKNPEVSVVNIQDPAIPDLRIVVVGTSERSSVLRRFAVYELAVTYGSSCQVIGKRFSEFKALDYTLRPKYSLPDFPDYSYRESSVDQEVVEGRKVKLQQYLTGVVDSDARTDPDLLKFLNLV